MKRPREDDAPSTNMFVPSPAGGSNTATDQPSPPKRIKVEWDGPPSEEVQQKRAAVEEIKTEEEANNFFIQELLKITQTDAQESNGLSDTLNMLLKASSQATGNTDDFSALGYGVSGITPLSPTMPKEDFEQYFDFTLGGTQDGDDDDSKTPELTSSSSTTNPSPGSNSGNEATTEGGAGPAVVEPKTEDSSDLTRLSFFKEIDGGESAFYQPTEFKWDISMPSLDQPWAIFGTS